MKGTKVSFWMETSGETFWGLRPKRRLVLLAFPDNTGKFLMKH